MLELSCENATVGTNGLMEHTVCSTKREKNISAVQEAHASLYEWDPIQGPS